MKELHLPLASHSNVMQHEGEQGEHLIFAASVTGTTAHPGRNALHAY